MERTTKKKKKKKVLKEDSDKNTGYNEMLML